MIKSAVFGRVFALALVLSGSAAFQAQAQDVPQAQLDAARKAITALNVTDRYDTILPALAERLKAQFIQSSPNFQDQISAIVDEQALALAPRRADLEKEAATIYAKSFSADELNTIATFFNTEAGKKLLSSTPLVSRELGRAAEIWTNGISRDLSAQATAKLRGVIDANPSQMPAAEATPAPAAGAAQQPAPTLNLAPQQ
ncbi:hypothetical protein SAMN03159496_03378 [Rhizobium sp. NFR07]|uniref:DUF2059 domain-containing protein n=1 Tax=Rhizobium sp. NFR07 TaxID=1566262 RepID=UPI0008ECD7F1|nr:DUF2059 domain-containing protein [Rhizobium sp. NFR07]SFB39208.1 hypothetical protein SAMN03159496_03378 [Rhizobium sp. NFR07]